MGHCSAFLHKYTPFALCRGSISDCNSAFSPKECSLVRGPLTIECLLMSGCGQGHKLVKDIVEEAVAQGFRLTHSRSGNIGEKRCD